MECNLTISLPGSGAARPSGFSIVEVIVCIGIVGLLVGLALPPLAHARDRARATALLAVLRQNSVLITAYANEWRDTYPIFNEDLSTSSMSWFEPLKAAGIIQNAEEIDREGIRLRGSVLYALSFAMMYDPALMRPGSTVPLHVARTRPVRQSQVLYPSAKGLMWQYIATTGRVRNVFWCCGAPWPTGPVTFADASGLVASAPDFAPGGIIRIENSIGAPIASTWNGYLGRDR